MSFRGFWYQTRKPDNGLKPDIERRENWPLRGLFWVPRDLYAGALEARDAMEPEAREVDITRNHAEHKYLKVHDDLWPEVFAMAIGPSSMPADASFSIGCEMLIQRTVRLAKLARSALTYLASPCMSRKRKSKANEARTKKS